MLAHAQFGIVGGINISGTNLETQNVWDNAKNVTLYHIGVAYHWDMALGFSIQPSLAFEMKGAKLDQSTSANVGDINLANMNLDVNSKSGYLELGAALQWGPDLFIARPFVFIQPFIGLQVTRGDSCSGEASVLGYTKPFDNSDYSDSLNKAKSNLEYGFGIGAGVELIRHLQLSVQYFLNLGDLYNNDGSLSSFEWETIKDIKNYNGVKVTLGYFF